PLTLPPVQTENALSQLNLMHDKEALEAVANAAHKDVPDVVHSYFGPYIGMYFAWLTYYTK
ncbi:unnamed protein product, partial [Hapterophycus canaliculatus]